MLRAQPRAVTERRVADLITKAAAMPATARADALRRDAQAVLTEQPPAPRRAETAAVIKARPG